MQAILIYLLKVVGCSAIFVFYYRFFLRNKHFHYYNRFFLLFAVGASIVLPLIQLSWFSMHSHNAELLALMQLYSGQYASAVIVTGEKAALDWEAIGQYLFLCSILLLLFPILRNIFSVKKLRKQYPQVKMGHFTLIETNLRQAPFSFFQDLFWRQDIDMASPVGQQILQHELTHIQQKHSWDKMFLQTACAVFWANPFFWYIKKEMSMIHEFIADEHALQGRDASDFAAMLLQAQFGQTYLSGINPFALSPIKRRLHMITHSKKPKYSYLRRLMALPLLAIMTMLLAFRYQEKKEEKAIETLKEAIAWQQNDSSNGLQSGSLSKVVNRTIVDTPPPIQHDSIKHIKLMLRGNDSLIFANDDYQIQASEIQIDKKVLTPFSNAIFFVDGKQTTNDVLNKLNPDNIQSIHVLKDNFATQKYGDKGKNGVVEIYTKKGTVSSDTITSITKLLTGKIAGMHIAPGKKSDIGEIRIRGYRSTADSLTVNNPPLMLIDGKIVDNDILKKIPPYDIKSIEVLKDLSATEKYGEKGKNGVILITTKEASKAKSDTFITVIGRATREKN